MNKVSNNNSNAVSNQEELRLPLFNRAIEIKVEVDSIYMKLMDTFPSDYKHRELLSHAIIGTAVTKGGLNYIYNALNGYENAIDFRVGDIVMCEAKERLEWYDVNAGVVTTHDGAEVLSPNIPNWKTRRVEIGECEVVEVNPYSDDKVKVKFMNVSNYREKTHLMKILIGLATDYALEYPEDSPMGYKVAVDTNK